MNTPKNYLTPDDFDILQSNTQWYNLEDEAKILHLAMSAGWKNLKLFDIFDSMWIGSPPNSNSDMPCNVPNYLGSLDAISQIEPNGRPPIPHDGISKISPVRYASELARVVARDKSVEGLTPPAHPDDRPDNELVAAMIIASPEQRAEAIYLCLHPET